MSDVHEAELVARVEPVIPPCDRWVVMYWPARSPDPYWAVGQNCENEETAHELVRADYAGVHTQIHHLSDRPSTAAAVVEAAVAFVQCDEESVGSGTMPGDVWNRMRDAVKAHLAAKAKNEGS